MGLSYEKVKLEHLGRGGAKDDVPLVDEVEDALGTVAHLVTDERAAGKGSVTVKITVAKAGEESVLITYSVQRKDPPMSRKGLSAVLGDEGELYAAHHKQEALDLPAPKALRTVNGEDQGGEP